MSRTETQRYPDLRVYISEIEKKGISPELLSKLINLHGENAKYNKSLYARYTAAKDGVPIFKRTPRFDQDAVNNKVNNDFFGEIVDFKTGYFAGKPAAYSYSGSAEAQSVTGGEEGVKAARKAITDFTTRNNMYGVDMEVTKFAGIYGYAGRLFFIDPEGVERVMPVHGFETILLSHTDITEPSYAVRYFETTDLTGQKKLTAEFYDSSEISVYTGTYSSLSLAEPPRPHMFDYCPLQGIANNREMLGDAEKALTLIDDYDKVLSDNSNEIEAFVHAYMIFEGLRIDDETIKKGQKSGSFVFPTGGTQQGKAYFLTKEINDAFTEHHLERLEDNIYRFSKTPNLNDDAFGAASGVSLKFKLHGLEAKCGMFQAQMMNAAQHMWKLLASAWAKKQIKLDPLQCTIDFKRNFPLDTLSEAQTAQALIGAGIPKEVAFSQLSFVEDVDYIMEMIEAEKLGVPSLSEDLPEDVELGQKGVGAGGGGQQHPERSADTSNADDYRKL